MCPYYVYEHIMMYGKRATTNDCHLIYWVASDTNSVMY